MRSSDPPAPTRSYRIAGTAFAADPLEGGLYLVATPIGNLGDVTLRALGTLAAVDIIYCEDTRITQRLLERYDIRTTLRTYHDHNAARARPAILNHLDHGAAVALVSDAGTPLISDPGFKLVRAVLDRGGKVEALPGPCAALAGLVLSGFPTDRFSFRGFLPNRPAARRSAVRELASEPASVVLYESPNRVEALLGEIDRTLPQREVCIAREMTKLHEEVMRGRPGDLVQRLARRERLKGEVVVVIAPAPEVAHKPDEPEVLEALREALETLPAGQAAASVARRFGLQRRDLYRQATTMTREDREE